MYRSMNKFSYVRDLLISNFKSLMNTDVNHLCRQHIKSSNRWSFDHSIGDSGQPVKMNLILFSSIARPKRWTFLFTNEVNIFLSQLHFGLNRTKINFSQFCQPLSQNFRIILYIRSVESPAIFSSYARSNSQSDRTKNMTAEEVTSKSPSRCFSTLSWLDYGLAHNILVSTILHERYFTICFSFTVMLQIKLCER